MPGAHNVLKAQVVTVKGQESTTSRLWSAKELAQYLGVSEKTARKKMADPYSPGFQVGKLWRILSDDARSFYGPAAPLGSSG